MSSVHQLSKRQNADRSGYWRTRRWDKIRRSWRNLQFWPTYDLNIIQRLCFVRYKYLLTFDLINITLKQFSYHKLKIVVKAKRNFENSFLWLNLIFLFVWMMLSKILIFADNRSNADSTSHTDGASTPDVVSAKSCIYSLYIY